MNREKFAWIVSIVLVVILAMQIPGTLASRDDDYSFVRTLVDIHRREATKARDAIIVHTTRGSVQKPNPHHRWDYYRCDDPKVAYIRITQITSETFDSLRPLMEKLLADGMKGLIMDLRFNPGGRLDQA